jgi:hypothetical protein
MSRASGAGVKNRATPAVNDVISNEKMRAFTIGVLIMSRRYTLKNGLSQFCILPHVARLMHVNDLV